MSTIKNRWIEVGQTLNQTSKSLAKLKTEVGEKVSPDTTHRVVLCDSAMLFARNGFTLPTNDPQAVRVFFGVEMPEGITRIRMERIIWSGEIHVQWYMHPDYGTSSFAVFHPETAPKDMATAVAVAIRMSR